MNPPPVEGALPLGGLYDSLPRGSLGLAAPRPLLVDPSRPAAYELDGTPARDTVLAMFESASTGQPPGILTETEATQAHEGDVVWGGRIIEQYGHFLTDSVARLWPLLRGAELEGLPVVFVAGKDGQGFVAEWLDAFGARIVELPARGVVRFERAHVPQPAMRHGAWTAPEIRDIHLQARRGLDISPTPGGHVVWLSRSGLARNRAPYDETLLEWLLGDKLRVVRPETMTVAEQVAALEGSAAVAGVVGSAFHGMLLTNRTPDCLYLCPPWERPAYAAQHRYLDSRAHFAPALAVIARKRRMLEGIVFPGGYGLQIPEALRALDATVLPGLLEDERIAGFAAPGRRSDASDDRLDAAVKRVLREPLAAEPRRELAATFAQEGLALCAAEQLAAAAELGGEPAPGGPP